MRKAAPINIIIHYPTTEEGRHELQCRVTEVHADLVLDYIRKLQCPSWQKMKLIDAIIEDAKKKNRSDRVVDTCEAHDPWEFCGTPRTPKNKQEIEL